MFGKIIVLFACASAFATAGAAPYTPSSGGQVLERLPGGLAPARRELQGLRAALAAKPGDLTLATTLAQRYIEQSRRDGDPRYLGYAQAALAPWWSQPQPPSPVLVLRATLRQSTHQFGPALTDLDVVLKRDSGNSQAWLTRATVQLITGDFPGARASCMRLYSRAPELVVQACLASVGSISGQAGASYERLRQTYIARSDSPPHCAPGSRPCLVKWLHGSAALTRPNPTTAKRWRWMRTTATCWAPTPISCSSATAHPR